MNPSYLLRSAWIVVSYATVLVVSRNDIEEGYYWREYKEDIPHDAFSATTDKPGKKVYIAQTVHSGTYIRAYPPDPYYIWRTPPGTPRDIYWDSGYYPAYPGYPYDWSDNADNCNSPVVVTGQIREGQKDMEYEWGSRKQVAIRNVQVLCTHNPEDFEWLETNTTQIGGLQGRHLVSGGVEKNYTVYVGRATLEDEVVVGKVLYTNSPSKDGFYAAAGDSFVHIDSLFEVLVYNPRK